MSAANQGRGQACIQVRDIHGNIWLTYLNYKGVPLNYNKTCTNPACQANVSMQWRRGPNGADLCDRCWRGLTTHGTLPQEKSTDTPLRYRTPKPRTSSRAPVIDWLQHLVPLPVQPVQLGNQGSNAIAANANAGANVNTTASTSASASASASAGASTDAGVNAYAEEGDDSNADVDGEPMDTDDDLTTDQRISDAEQRVRNLEHAGFLPNNPDPNHIFSTDQRMSDLEERVSNLEQGRLQTLFLEERVYQLEHELHELRAILAERLPAASTLPTDYENHGDRLHQLADAAVQSMRGETTVNDEFADQASPPFDDNHWLGPYAPY